MAHSNHIKNVAIVGATGNLGSVIVQNLAASSNGFHITAITRSDKGSFKDLPSVSVKAGDYDSPEFLRSALKSNDALIIVLAFTAPQDLQTRFIEAAADAGVPWVMPCEFGSDNGNPTAERAVPINASKRQYRERVEELGKSSWVGIVCNPWIDMTLAHGAPGINIKDREVEFYDDGNTKMNMSTIAQTGRAVAALFSLPIKPTDGSQPSLSDYKNDFVYISSFLVSQRQILDAVQATAGTEGWSVSYTPVDQVIQRSQDMLAKGDIGGLFGLLMGTMLKPGVGGNYEETKGTANKILGLPQEDLNEVVRGIVEQVEAQ